jgi:ribosomal protein S6--L-glutamate ligase
MVEKGKTTYIALGSRLRGVPEVRTLGVKPNFKDYTPEERTLIHHSKEILFPTMNYAQFFSTVGKKIFPSLETYLYADDKIKQTTLFYLLDIPHPRTKFYFHRHRKDILKDFQFPFVAKLPRSSACGRGVFLISTLADLENYLKLTPVAYIQEFLPHERDLRVILVEYEPILAYWREHQKSDFRTNLHQGGILNFDGIPPKSLDFARQITRKCHFNDVGIDLILHNGQWFLIEANMKYGRTGLKMKGLDLKEILREKLLSGAFFS